MSIATRITSIEEHIGNAYNKLEDIGVDLTNVDKNINNIATQLEQVYEDYPKITATDTEASLNNTKAGRMEVGLKGNTAQATRILPTGYTQLDYIESTGTQSIGTSISGSGTWKLKIQGTSNTGSTQIILGRASGRGHWFGISSGGKYTLGGGIDTTKNYNELIEANMTITDTGISLTIGNETVTRDNEYLVTNAYNLIGLDSYLSHIKMYRASFYQNNVLKNDLIPCKNSSNVVGMYDIITNTFYQNAGTGTFTAGNTVTIPNPDYTQVIQNVSGSNTIKVQNKNLNDGINFKFYLTSDCTAYKTSENDNGLCIKVNGATSITISTTVTQTRYRVACTNSLPSSTQQNCYNGINKDGTNNNITINTSGYEYLLVNATDLSSIQIEQGSTATDYVSHAEQNLPVNLKSKNLFNINQSRYDHMATASVSNNTLTVTTSGSYGGTDYLNIPAPINQICILTLNWTSDTAISGTDARLYVYDGAEVGTLLTYENLVGTSGTVTKTFTNTTGKISIRFSPNNKSGANIITMNFTNIMIEKRKYRNNIRALLGLRTSKYRNSRRFSV